MAYRTLECYGGGPADGGTIDVITGVKQVGVQGITGTVFYIYTAEHNADGEEVLRYTGALKQNDD